MLFRSEMDSIFRTRGSGISSDVETTVVPQLLAEIDGVEGLKAAEQFQPRPLAQGQAFAHGSVSGSSCTSTSLKKAPSYHLPSPGSMQSSPVKVTTTVRSAKLPP